MRKTELPAFVPLRQEIFDELGLPFSVTTVYKHRSTGGPLRHYTRKDPATGKVLFLVRDWFADFLGEGGYGGRRRS